MSVGLVFIGLFLSYPFEFIVFDAYHSSLTGYPNPKT